MANFLNSTWNLNFLNYPEPDIFQMSYNAVQIRQDNFIPSFQSKFQSAELLEIANIANVFLCKINTEKRTIESKTAIDLSKLEILEKDINGVAFTAVYLPKKFLCNDISTTLGTYQLEIIFTTQTLYTDLFQMKGVPIATYSCSEAQYLPTTNEFSIKITRTDSNAEAFPNSNLTVEFYSALFDNVVDLAGVDFALDVAEFEVFTFPLASVPEIFDTFIWSGACNGILEMNLLISENGKYLITENGNSIIKE